MKNLPVIDLYNFENPEFSQSKFILTSPRSLKACISLNIKPCELLKQDFNKLIQTNANHSFSELVNIFESNELERRAKLNRCRHRRNQLIENVIQGDNEFNIENINRTLNCEKMSLSQKALPNPRKSNFSPKRSSSACKKVRDLRSFNSISDLRSIEGRFKTQESIKKFHDTIQRRKFIEKAAKENLEYHLELKTKSADEAIKRSEANFRDSIQRRKSQRLEREKNNKLNLEKQERKRDQELKMQEEFNRIKNERSEYLLREKMEKLKESRNFAMEAERLRDQIRKAYQLDSFDKMVRKAELVNKIGLGSNIY